MNYGESSFIKQETSGEHIKFNAEQKEKKKKTDKIIHSFYHTGSYSLRFLINLLRD